jgi:hypothetical protein
MFGGKSGPIAKISTTASRAGDHFADVPRSQKAAKKFYALTNKAEDSSTLEANVADVARTQRAGKKFTALRNKKNATQ